MPNTKDSFGFGCPLLLSNHIFLSGSALILVGWIRIQEGKKTSEEISCLEVLEVIFSKLIFSCSLDVLLGGLEIIKIAIFDPKIQNFFSALKIFCLQITTLDLDP